MNNRGYDPEVFTVTKEHKEIALLPNIGKFCACGCGKRIEGAIIKRKIANGKFTTYYRKPEDRKIFATPNCNWRVHNKGKPKPMLHANIKIKTEISNGELFRTLTIYLRKEVKQTFKITPDQKEIWAFMDKVERFRDISKPLESLA